MVKEFILVKVDSYLDSYLDREAVARSIRMVKGVTETNRVDGVYDIVVQVNCPEKGETLICNQEIIRVQGVKTALILKIVE